MDKIFIRPTIGVLATYRRLSYTPWYAIAEFVDNSTASYYKYYKELNRINSDEFQLNVNINYNPSQQKLVIADDAFGMDLQDFIRAIVIDSPPADTSGRNEFGMGLKTAASWFGDKWKVETTRLGSKIKYSTTVDIKQLVANKPDEIEYREESAYEFEHYTVITIWGLAHTIKGRTVGRVKQELESIYRRDINSGKVNIEWKGDSLEYQLPILRTNKDGEMRKKIFFSVYNEHANKQLHVKGWVGILETGSRANAGLTLFRRGRVITGGLNRNYRPQEIFKGSGSFEYQRIIGEIDLDDWPVSQAKDSIDWSGDLEESFIMQLKDQVTELIDYAKNARWTKTEVNPIDFVDSIKVNIGKDIEKKFNSVTGIPLEMITEKIMEITTVNDDVDESLDVISEFQLQDIKYKLFWDDRKNSSWISVNTSPLDQNIKEIIVNVTHPYFIPFNENPEFVKMMNILIVSLVHSIDKIEKTQQSVQKVRLYMNELLQILSGDVVDEC